LPEEFFSEKEFLICKDFICMGDEKQSIYKFQRSKFREKFKEMRYLLNRRADAPSING